MSVSLPRLLVAWIALCVAAWLLLSLSELDDQAECRARGDVLCFSTGEVFYVLGLVVLAAAAVGALVIAVAWTLVMRLRRP